MATVKGVNRTLADAQATSDRIGKGLVDGRLKIISDTYEAAAVDIGDTIEMGTELPLGAKVHEIVLMADALGGSVTLAVGDAEVAARYISATAMNTANKVTRLNVIAGRQYEVDETTPSTTDRQVLITVAGAAATGTITLDIVYAAE